QGLGKEFRIQIRLPQIGLDEAMRPFDDREARAAPAGRPPIAHGFADGGENIDRLAPDIFPRLRPQTVSLAPSGKKKTAEDGAEALTTVDWNGAPILGGAEARTEGRAGNADVKRIRW